MCVNQILVTKPSVCKAGHDGGMQIARLQFTVNLSMFVEAWKGWGGAGRKRRKDVRTGEKRILWHLGVGEGNLESALALTGSKTLDKSRTLSRLQCSPL